MAIRSNLNAFSLPSRYTFCNDYEFNQKKLQKLKIIQILASPLTNFMSKHFRLDQQIVPHQRTNIIQIQKNFVIYRFFFLPKEYQLHEPDFEIKKKKMFIRRMCNISLQLYCCCWFLLFFKIYFKKQSVNSRVKQPQNYVSINTQLSVRSTREL